MNPLSVFIYYSRNKRKALPVLLILAFTVFGISLSLVLSGTSYDSLNAIAAPYSKFVVLEPNHNLKSYQLDPGVRAQVHRSTHLAVWMPVVTQWTYRKTVGPPVESPLFAVEDDQMATLLAVTGTQVFAGRLPNSRADEVALNDKVARSRGLWLGSEIGNKVDPEDRINGKWTIVGILSGDDTPFNLMSLQRATKGQTADGMLLIPRPGEMDALVADVETAASNAVLIQTPAYWHQLYAGEMEIFDLILNAINVVVIVVLSVGVGLLNVIYFRQRLSEFGLLLGIGYSRLYVVRRVTLEALMLSVVAWLVGLTLSLLVYQILNTAIFEAQGMTLKFLDARVLSATLPVPLCVWLFSTTTVVWPLIWLDPVAAIEQRD